MYSFAYAGLWFGREFDYDGYEFSNDGYVITISTPNDEGEYRGFHPCFPAHRLRLGGSRDSLKVVCFFPLTSGALENEVIAKRSQPMFFLYKIEVV